MSLEPTTEAGRHMLELMSDADWIDFAVGEHEDQIQRIEAEARSAALDEAVAAVEALEGFPRLRGDGNMDYLVWRSAVLEALRGTR